MEETDELLLWDEELADCDPEYLPKRLITDFSIYNAEVCMPQTEWKAGAATRWQMN